MKPLLIFLLLFSFFSCKKDESDLLNEKYSKEEIFNAMVGTWKFSRLGYDAEFKRIKKINAKECTENNRNILSKDGTITAIDGCFVYDEDYEDESAEMTGTFQIRFSGYVPSEVGTYVFVQKSGFNLIPGKRWYGGWLTLHSFTDSTLVFSDVKWESEDGPQYDEYKLFSELKRVK